MRCVCWRNKRSGAKKLRNWRIFAYLAVTAALLLMVGGLCLLTVHSSDDFWYSTFLDDGIGVYVQRMRSHYEAVNGRVWVHILAHILLHAGNWLFALVCCSCCLVMSFCVGSAVGLGRERLGMLTAMFSICIAFMPSTLFVEGILWLSAFCNYLVPTTVMCVMFWQMERRCATGWLLLTAFLCGSATEQIGMTAMAALVLYLVKDRAHGGYRWAGLAAAALGLLTVFASPATGKRAVSEVPLSSMDALFGKLEASFAAISAIVTNEAVIVLLLAILLIQCGRLVGKHFRPAVWIGWGSGALALGLVLWKVEIQMFGCLVLFGLLALFALWLLLLGYQLPGSLILSALASVCVMLPTNSVGCRNLIPFYLLISLTVCLLAAQWLSARLQNSMAGVALGCAVLALIWLRPMADGVWENYRVDQQNRQTALRAAEQEVFRYDAGYDPRYTFKKAYTTPNFQKRYLESVGVDPDKPFELCCNGAPLSVVSWAGVSLKSPVLRCVNDIDMIPLRAIIETLGGTVDWSPECIEVELDGIQCRLLNLGSMAVKAEWKSPDGAFHRMKICRIKLQSDTYFESKLLTEVFGLTVTWNTDGQTGTILKKS